MSTATIMIPLTFEDAAQWSRSFKASDCDTLSGWAGQVVESSLELPRREFSICDLSDGSGNIWPAEISSEAFRKLARKAAAAAVTVEQWVYSALRFQFEKNGGDR